MSRNSDSSAPRKWLITGCSTGLGLAMARAAIARGDEVVVTARDERSVMDLVAMAPERVHGVSLDLSNETSIVRGVASAIARLGRIDVLVSNAATGLLGAFEEIDAAEVRGLFDVNVFGPMALARDVLPIMRQQRSGHIVFVTSVGSLMGFPGASIYGASKAALDAAAESLRCEVEPLGIKVSCLVPGLFKTDFRTRTMVQAKRVIEDYRPMIGPLRARGDQAYPDSAGDPALVGEALLDLVDRPAPPFRLPVGPDAIQIFNDAAHRVRAEAATGCAARAIDSGRPLAAAPASQG